MDEDDGVFALITKLCEKFYSKPDKIKKARSECYELLLGKKVSSLPQKFKDLQGTKDPVCNLLAWQYTLSHDYDMPQEALKLRNISNELEEIYASCNKLDVYNNILIFLMSLRDIPIRKDDPTDLSYVPKFEMKNFTEMFKLPKHIIEETLEYNNNLFQLDNKKKSDLLPAKSLYCCCSALTLVQPSIPEPREEIENTPPAVLTEPEENIWAIAAKEPYRSYRNWENYGYSEPDKELPFMSELGESSSLWVETLQVQEAEFSGRVAFKTDTKSLEEFVKDAKYLLVGIASEIFTYRNSEKFTLVPAISLHGIRENVFGRFCDKLILAGDCYRYLNQLSEPDWYIKPMDHESIILRAFRKEISYYLAYYRTCVIKIPNTTPPVVFYTETTEIRDQIVTITQILKKGSDSFSSGVALIDFLFKEFSNQMDEKVSQILYCLLAPCIQAYFQHFIFQWVLHGTINDPHNDFFVKINCKNIISKNRLMWSQSFTIQNSQVPFFLVDLKDDILQCGKIMCLLKICNKFDLCFMGEKPKILHDCVTTEQLKFLEFNINTYQLEVRENCGPIFSLSNILEKRRGFNEEYLNTIAQKRLATIKRIELERKVEAEEKQLKKVEAQKFLMKQYDIAVQLKQMEKMSELDKEIKLLEAGINLDKRLEALMSEEAADMIQYYEKLNKIADERKKFTDKVVEKLKQQLELSLEEIKTTEEIYEETSNEMFADSTKKVDRNPPISTENLVKEDIPSKLDILNANLAVEEKLPQDSHENKIETCTHIEKPKIISEAQRNKNKVMSSEFNINKIEEIEIKPQNVTKLTEAQKNKLKVLSTEFGIGGEIKPSTPVVNRTLTQAQKNKIKILGSEFDIKVDNTRIKIDKEITDADINKFKMMTSKFELMEKISTKRNKLDNENALNKNEEDKIVEKKEEVIDKNIRKNDLNLDLEIDALNLNHLSPMSIDSTPVNSFTPCIGPSGGHVHPIGIFDCPGVSFTPFHPESKPSEVDVNSDFVYKNIPKAKLSDVRPLLMEKCLFDGLQLTLSVHKKIIENSLLKYFINDLGYLDHLDNLRKFFFMQDGEFCRVFTDILFERLYSVQNNPKELLNNRVLGYITHGHLSNNGLENLSFKINKIPERFDLLDVNVFKCISLTYKIVWPLNIILPHEAIIRYNTIFLFLLKMSRPSWVLRKIFLELRLLAKKAGKKKSILMMSPHYTSIQSSRFIMTQFTKSLESYVIGEVFKTHWSILEENLSTATSLDEVYQIHTKYLKNILFQCLLSEKSAPLKKVLDKILTTILKFFYYLKAKNWICKDGLYLHPNFDKLESITNNFKELVLFFIRVGKKVVKSGYQQQLQQFLNLIDVNQYYTKMQMQMDNK